jgi:hypothetical protein
MHKKSRNICIILALTICRKDAIIIKLSESGGSAKNGKLWEKRERNSEKALDKA